MSYRKRALKEPPRPRECLACGISFTPKRAEARYCSGKCSTPQWRKENPDHIRAYAKQRRLRLRQAGIAKKSPRPRDKDKANAYLRAWKKSHKERVSAYERKRWAKNRERECAKQRAYTAKNKHLVKTWKATSNAKRRGSLVDPLAIKLTAMLNLLKYGQYQCEKCGKPLGVPGNSKFHIDHIMPIAIGGQTVIGNLQILCPTCNTSKHTRVESYVPIALLTSPLVLRKQTEHQKGQ